MSSSAPQAAAFASNRFEQGRQFVRRIYLPRTAGLALGAVAIAPVLWTNGARALVWLLLGLGCFVWPHVAYMLGMSSADPHTTERRSLMVDSALGGLFIGLMSFNLLPSVLLLVMLSMDKLAVGGPKFLARCTLALVAACVFGAWANGFDVRPGTTLLEIVGCLPLFIVYPVAVGITTYNMVRRMNYQSRQLEAMSRTDGLSHMLTRQAWDDAAIQEFTLSRRTGSPASIILIDIDNLNGINQLHGYPTGDEVIRSVAVIVRNAVRPQDLPGRYGGQEFAILLPGADAVRAGEVAERAREAIASSVVEKTGKVSATASIGFAQLQPHDEDHRVWIAHADEALHSAKLKGGNAVVRYRPLKPVRVSGSESTP